MTNSVPNANNKWSSNHCVTLFDAQIMTHSVTTPDRDGSKSCGLIVHFTVLCLVAGPLSGSEAGVDLALIQTLLLFICKYKLVSMRTT